MRQYRKVLFVALLALSGGLLLRTPAHAVAKTVSVGVLAVPCPLGLSVFLDRESGSCITTVHAGDTVHWVPVPGSPDTVTSTGENRLVGPCGTEDTFNSGPLPPAGSFDHTFNNPGTCAYFGMIHGAVGEVIVLPSTTVSTTTTITEPSTTTTTSSIPFNTTTTIPGRCNDGNDEGKGNRQCGRDGGEHGGGNKRGRR